MHCNIFGILKVKWNAIIFFLFTCTVEFTHTESSWIEELYLFGTVCLSWRFVLSYSKAAVRIMVVAYGLFFIWRAECL